MSLLDLNLIFYPLPLKYHEAKNAVGVSLQQSCVCEGKSVPLRSHTQIINIMEFVRLALSNLDSFVSMDKVTFSVDI